MIMVKIHGNVPVRHLTDSEIIEIMSTAPALGGKLVSVTRSYRG